MFGSFKIFEQQVLANFLLSLFKLNEFVYER